MLTFINNEESKKNIFAIIPIYRKDHPRKTHGSINCGLVGTFLVCIVGLLICVLNYPVYAYIKGNKE